jgi:hypothetical protein
MASFARLAVFLCLCAVVIAITDCGNKPRIGSGQEGHLVFCVGEGNTAYVNGGMSMTHLFVNGVNITQVITNLEEKNAALIANNTALIADNTALRNDVANITTQQIALFADNTALKDMVRQFICSEGKMLGVFNQINTHGAFDWEYFSFNDKHYLAVANHHNDATRNIPSALYKYDPTTDQFVEFQTVDTHGARDWEYFSFDDKHYLAVANAYNGATYNIPSALYKYDPTTDLFVEFQTVDTHGAQAWEYFSFDNNHYLAVANYYNGATRNIPSTIYHLNALC